MKKILGLFLFFLPVIANAQEIKLGVLPPLTGPFAELGDDCRRGVEVAVSSLAPGNKIGDREIKLIYGDSQADPKIGINEYKKLTEQDKVLAVVAIRGTICLPLNPISSQKHIPLLCGSGHPNFHSGNEYAHQSWPLTKVEGGMLAEHVLSDNVKKIAIITGEDDWLLSLTTNFIDRFKSKAGEVIASEQVLATDYDFNSLLTKIRAKKPEGLFVNLSLAQGPVIVKRARELGIKAPVYSNFWLAQDSALKSAGPAIEGMTFPEAVLDYPNFNQALASLANPKKPSGATISCLASTAAVLIALKQNSSISNSEQLQQELLKLKKIDVLDVSIPVENRHFLFPMAIKQIKDSKVVKIK